jgi:hypothetical protein
MGAAVAAAAIHRKEREVREDFQTAGATQPISACSLADLGLDESMTMRRLMNRSIIREASPGLFYWDEDVYRSVRSMRRRMAFLMAAVMLIVGIMLAYGGSQLK